MSFEIHDETGLIQILTPWKLTVSFRKVALITAYSRPPLLPFPGKKIEHGESSHILCSFNSFLYFESFLLHERIARSKQ